MIERREKLGCGNFNWGFVLAMLLIFAVVIGVIVGIASLLAIGGCSEQVTEVTADRMYVRTSCFMREFSNSGGKLVVEDPNSGRRYELTFGDHDSKSSAGKVRLVHPSGIAGEVVIE